MHTTTMSKYEDLANELRKKIENLPVGARLPSVRSLMKRHSISVSTVNNALRRLEREGLLETRAGSGAYVSPQKGVRYIEIHRMNNSPGRNMDAKELSLGEAVRRAGWKLLARRHSEHEDDGDPNSLPLNKRACAHVVMPNLCDPKLAFFSELLTQKTEVVAYGRLAGPLNICSVTGNDQQILNHLIKHLAALGHRKFALLVNEPHFFEVQQRIELFIGILELLDFPPPEIIDCHTPPGQSSLKMAHKGLAEHLAHHKKPKFTALVTASASGAMGALRALSEHGLRVPQDCSLAAATSEPANGYTVPSITDAGIKESSWGEGVVQVLQKRFEMPEGSPINLQLPAVFHARESTGAPPGPVKSKRKAGNSSPSRRTGQAESK